MSSKKSEVLFNEAIKDIRDHNYNKAVSAIYFSIRKELENILIIMGLSIPRRDDKLANVLKHLGFKDEAVYFLKLYEYRKKADYSDENLNKEDVEHALELYNKILTAIKTLGEKFSIG
jgi:uncharacterized protein (UPF0332 family)